jgi:hypothetical protein
MLLEQLVTKAAQPPAYDWEAYYHWYFGRLTGNESGEVAFWQCTNCLSVNLLVLPARYGTCRACGLSHLPSA